MTRPGRSERAERSERRDEAEAAWFRQRSVSCLECGVLCLRRVEDPHVYDVPTARGEHLVVIAFGLSTLLGQGIGIADGGRHQCPPVPEGVPFGPSD